MADAAVQKLGLVAPPAQEAHSTPSPSQGTKRRADDELATQQSQPTLATPVLSGTAHSPAVTLVQYETPADGSRASSPALSSAPSHLDEANPALPLTSQPARTAGPPQKRVKLTSAEKAQREAEKAQKAKDREAKKAQREEEQRAKDEDKRKKNEEREEKKREKEMEKQQKDLEKQQKELEKQAKEQAKLEEREKKERAQPKLMAFFGKPTVSSSSVSICRSPDNRKALGGDVERIKIKSLEPTNTDATGTGSSPSKAHLSDYRRHFLPFSFHPNVILAPVEAFLLTESQLTQIRDRLDNIADGKIPAAELQQAIEKDNQARFKSRRSAQTPKTYPIKDLIAALNGSESHPIDLTSEGAIEDPLTLIRETPMRYIHFFEDVRPPYCGTFTKPLSARAVRHLALNPSARTLPEINYDYDSEAEWEDPEEGEDLDEDDSEEDDDDDDDMDGFLDDEDDVGKPKHGALTGEAAPVSTGLCWENAQGKLVSPEDSADLVPMNECKMGILLDGAPVSINPFSTAYWAEPIPVVNAFPTTEQTIASMMNPPRLPLTVRPNASNTLIAKATSKSALSSGVPKVPKRMIAPDLMDEFKREVDGSDMTKIALIEALKKKFPKQPKDAITNTLNSIAARVGSSNAEKRWRLVTPA